MRVSLIFLSLTLIICQHPCCYCDSDDFKSNVDGFMKALDDYSSEVSSKPVGETSLGNEIHAEQSSRPEVRDGPFEGIRAEGADPKQEDILETETQFESSDAMVEDALKTEDEDGLDGEKERDPVQEELAVKETVLQPGDEIRHELTEQVQLMADRAISSISPQLHLVKVIEALSMVSSKVRRSLSLLVSRDPCADAACVAACRVELESRGTEDEVTWHNCIGPLDTNEVPREKRGAVGGFKQVDDAEANKLADTAVTALDHIDADNYKRKVIKVLRAQKQLVNGIMYHLTLEVASTSCQEDLQKCEAEFIGGHNICKILMQRLFIGEAPHNAQLIKSECTPISQLKELEFQKRVRRQADDQDFETNFIPDHKIHASQKKPHRDLVGGKTPQDTNSGKIQEIVEFALKEIDKSSNSMNKQKIVRVVHVHSQVVAGVKYFLKLELIETDCPKRSDREVCSAANNKVLQSCDVVVWDKPWEKFRAIRKIDCHPVESSRRKRESHRLGGLRDANPDDPEIQEMAKFAVAQLDAKSNSEKSQKLLIVKEAKTQVVAGMNYYLKIDLVETNCRKGSVVDHSCSSTNNKVIKECDVVVYNRPWDKHRELTSANCIDMPEIKHITKREVVPGGHSQIDHTSDEIKQLAQLAVEDMNKKSNSLYTKTLVEIYSAHSQVVSGVNYHLKLRVAETNCMKNSAAKTAACLPKSTAQEECDVTIWSQPWLKKQQITKSDCHQMQIRSVGTAENKNHEVKKRSVTELHDKFEDFKRTYNKVYSDGAEHQKRFRIFRANLLKIKALQENEQGTATYGPNMFADLSAKEFKQKYLGLKPGVGPELGSNHMVHADIPNVSLPVEFDWRDHDAVTPVKNQGMCGSCWAFSVTGNVEGQWAIKHKKLISLSEQELVDCDKKDDGCSGGYMTTAYEVIEELGGLETEQDYPYDAKNEACKLNKTDVQAVVTGSVNITTNETQIAQWLYAKGPISIGINANAMQFYMGGVSHPFKFLCNKNQLDHGVLLVGFGVHRSSIRHKMLPYWLIKNSWGPHWGEKGYYRVYRGDSTCGVNQMASSAIVE